MNYFLVRCIILTLALALSPAALGEVYKWVDTEGQVHYSDRQPPPDVKNAEVFDIPERDIETAPAAPTQPASSTEELERIRKLSKELETDRKAREAERAALEEQRRRESLANQEQEQEEAPEKQEPDYQFYYPYPVPYGCCPFPAARCGPRYSTSCCLLYPWTCNTIQPPPLLPAPPAPPSLRPPWRPEPPRRPKPPPQPPQRSVHPPLDQPGSSQDWKHLPAEW